MSLRDAVLWNYTGILPDKFKPNHPTAEAAAKFCQCKEASSLGILIQHSVIVFVLLDDGLGSSESSAGTPYL
jgi:hypothetical protein